MLRSFVIASLLAVSCAAQADSAVSVNVWGPNGSIRYHRGPDVGYRHGNYPGYHHRGPVAPYPVYRRDPRTVYAQPWPAQPVYVQPSSVYIQTTPVYVERETSRFTWITPDQDADASGCSDRVSRVCTGNTCVICK